MGSAGLEDQEGVVILGEVEESEHVEVVVEGSRQVLADHTLPLTFPRAELRLVFLEVLHQLEADVLLEQLLWFLEGLLDEGSGFCMDRWLLRTMSLTSCSFMSLCLSLKGGRSASGSLTSSSSSSSYMLVIYFESPCAPI
jgi:hypothetical protein